MLVSLTQLYYYNTVQVPNTVLNVRTLILTYHPHACLQNINPPTITSYRGLLCSGCDY